MAIRVESGITLEADNRKEEMYHWGAQILDLCGMSPEAYKNSTVVTVQGTVICSGCSGGGSGETGTTSARTYGFSVLCTKTDELTGEDYAAIIAAQGTGFDYISSYVEIDFGGEKSADVPFYIPCEYVPGMQS